MNIPRDRLYKKTWHRTDGCVLINDSKDSTTLGARGFFLVRGDRIERWSREGESRSGEKKERGLSPTSTTRSDERSSPLASEKTSGVQGNFK